MNFVLLLFAYLFNLLAQVTELQRSLISPGWFIIIAQDTLLIPEATADILEALESAKSKKLLDQPPKHLPAECDQLNKIITGPCTLGNKKIAPIHFSI